MEEIFVRYAPVLHLHIGGQVVRTTGEHPFYVVERADWIPARDLAAGEYILSNDGQEIRVEEIFDTGEWDLVYNLRVADWHTYFVGTASWGWAAWAHNDYSTLRERVDAAPAGQYGTKEQAARGRWTGERGRSKFIPADTPENTEILALLKANGVDGVDYRMGKPTFGPFAEGTVTTSRMTSSRSDNFAIGDELLARQWGVTTKEVTAYRDKNNLTWHELNNLKTMQLVPSKINGFFDHIGGVAEAKRAGL